MSNLLITLPSTWEGSSEKISRVAETLDAKNLSKDSGALIDWNKSVAFQTGEGPRPSCYLALEFRMDS
jgi:hypothetical protein